MALKNLAVVFPLFAANALFSCTPNSTVSQLRHDAAHPIADGASDLNWVELSRDEARTWLENNTSSPLLDDAHPFSRRMQHWVDAIDGELRVRFATELKKVPRPIVFVANDESHNAHAFGVAVCVESQTENRANADASREDFAIGVERFDSLAAYAEENCVLRPQLRARLAELVEFQSGDTGKCRVTLEDGSVVISGVGCLDLSGGVKIASHYAHHAQSNFVVLSKSLVDIFSQEQHVVSILAHELSHYYRAHASVPDADYNVVYRVGEKSFGKRPIYDPSLKPLEEKLRNIAWSVSTEFPGQKFASELYAPIGNENAGVGQQVLLDLISPICKGEAPCAQSCKPYIDLFAANPSAARAAVMHEPREFAFIAVEEQELLKEVEIAFEQCAAAVPLSSQVTSGHIQQSELEAIFATEKYSRLFAEPFPTTNTLLEFARAQSSRLRETPFLARKVFKESEGQRLGFYTKEQEADELSLELLAQVGVDPLEAARAFALLAEYGDAHSQDRNDERLTRAVTGEQAGGICRYLMDNEWKDFQGNALFIAIGALSEPHHSSCFRAFNLTGESRAHQFEVNNKEKYALEGWDELVQHLAAL